MKLWSTLLPILSLCATPAFASVNVSTPANGATVTSPVAYKATGTSSCAAGVSAMGVYVNNQLAVQQPGASLATTLTLSPGTYQTVVQEWDKCGGSTTTPIAITVAAAAASGVTVSAPAAGATVASPVAFAASASAPSCASGVAATGIYVGNVLKYQVKASSLSTSLAFANGAQSAVVQEWDNCGGSTTRQVNFVVSGTTATSGVTVSAPAAGATVSSPVAFSATAAASSCASGVAAMGIYVNNVLKYQVNGSTLSTSLAFASGAQSAVVQEWDNCGGSLTKPVAFTVSGSTTTPPATGGLTGILEWKGNSKSIGQYTTETALTLANVNTTQFGKIRQVATDGAILAQPIYARAVNTGAGGVHDIVVIATEHDSIYGFDGQSTSTTPLWHRSFLNAAAGITTQADNHGGRSTFGGEIGITGTPVLDPATGIVYVVSATTQGGVVTDTLHALDIRTGNDAAAGSTPIHASVAGTGEANVNGVISFTASQQNQRPGLVINHGVLYIAFGSFSDSAPYHGWLFAYDPTSLKQLASFISSPNYRADYDGGSAAAFWNGGAAPSFEDDGTFYVVAADGSTDVENGGVDYGDTVLHMQYSNGRFSVVDWFTPFNRDCIDRADLEMGSGGFALLPEAEVGNGRHLGVVLTKEGRLYLLDRTNLGHFDATADQSVQMFMVGDHQCDANTPGSSADGPLWNRLYGDASYWNGNLYMAASNQPIKQFKISGTAITPTPYATGSAATYYRGGNTIVSSSGNSNAIVWMYNKTSDGDAVLHAYDATNVSKELWNSSINRTRDGLTTGGEGFAVPIVIDGKVFAISGSYFAVYKNLN